MKKENIIYGKQIVSLLLEQYPKMIKELHAFKPDEWLLGIRKTNLPIKIRKTSPEKLVQLTEINANHQGIVAIVESYPYFAWEHLLESLKSRTRDLILILDKIQDPQNFGAIIRSASLLGVQNIIIPSNQQALVNSTVIRASVGTAYLLKITQVGNLNQTINQLKKIGYWIYSSNLNQQAMDIRKVDFAQKSGLIVGNEHRGVSQLLTKNSDQNLFIPTTQTIDSLNVSTATAIALFQISSQLGLI